MNYTAYTNRLASELKGNTELVKHWVTSDEFVDQETWLRGLAVCKYVLHEQELIDEAYVVYCKLMEGSCFMLSSMLMSSEDYQLWFADIESLHKTFIAAEKHKAYAFLFDLLNTARFGFRDTERGVTYLTEGTAKGDLLSKAFLGYSTYYGIGGLEVDQAVGYHMIEDVSQSREHVIAKLFMLNIEFRNCTNAEEGWKVIQRYGKLFSEEKKGLYVIADYYIKEDNYEKAVEYLALGVENNSGYSAYMLGSLASEERILAQGYDVAQGLTLLSTAFAKGIPYAAFVEGRIYQQRYMETRENQEQFITLLEQAGEYYYVEALELLGRFFLYDEIDQDVERGMAYLDRAIAMGSAVALTEKGIAYLNEVVDKDASQAKALLEQGVALGDFYAAFQLGIAWQNGAFAEGADLIEALSYFEKAAEVGHLYSIEYVARYYRHGYTGDTDAEKALTLYRRGVEEFNSDFSRVELAMMLINGEGTTPDIEEAHKLLLQAHENNYAYAAVRLGIMYEDGLLGDVDEEKAREYFSLASEEGKHPEGIYNYARLLRYGIGGPQDEVAALAFFKEALSLGYLDANVDVALAYEEGSCGEEANPSLAFQYMKAAAEEGISYAQYKLGAYYCFGYAVEEDKVVAREWLEQAVDGGSPLAMLLLGDFYLYDYIPGDDFSKAFEYYKAAASLDYISEGIGVCYQFGIGVDEDLEQAFQFYKTAEERGYDEGAFRVGQCLYWGTGTPENRTLAYDYLKRVANKGNAEAAYYVGNMLVKGESVEKDSELGASYLLQSAEQEMHQAQYELGNCYLIGEGVEQSDDQALYWYQRAAENGNEEAEKIVGKPRKRR